MADNYSRAVGYYRNHSDANTIRKIQNFLASKGYYDGDLDGIFGRKTYDAVRAYQQKYGLDVDGMWGESTNSVHRVLNATNAPYRTDASGKSGAHSKYMRGVNTGVSSQSSTIKTSSDLYKAIDDLKAKYYSQGGEDWFWGNSQDATQWRNFLHKTKQGQAILDEFYDMAENPSKINYRKMTTGQKEASYQKGVSNAISNAGESTAKAAAIGAGALAAISNPITAVGAVVGGTLGGLAGGRAGRLIGRDIYKDSDTYGYTQNGLMGTPSSVVMPAQEHGAQQGEKIGEVVGGTLGSLAGGYAANNFSPTQWYAGMKQSNYKGIPREISQVRATNGTFTRNFSNGVDTSFESPGAALLSSPNASLSNTVRNIMRIQGAPLIFRKQGGKLIPRHVK